MAHIVKCRICRQEMNLDKLDSSVWIMPSVNYYYHCTCYNDWKANKNNLKANGKDEAFWSESLIDYLYRDVKMSIDFSKLTSQWKNFIKPGRSMTPKGVYFAVRYYYDVLHGDKEKAAGGIGIVANIYNDAAQYWTDLEMRKAGTIDAIIAQIKERKERPIQLITKKEPTKANKSKFNLDDI